MKRQRDYVPVECQCGCGETISIDAMVRDGKPRKFLNSEHMLHWRRATGFYERLSAAGLQAQRDMQKRSGKRPGHEKRSAAAKRSNRLTPRKKKVMK